ncbi:Asp23/Gls24 family envelope stress response protein [Oscillospiraceae bacterium CM]|nr:Asp23/Gls24 family envelope stress response protein [Oscillospiraceae bacterium CM]
MGENKEYITYTEERGSINISEEVVATIAGGAALDVDGVAGLYSTPGRDIAELLAKKHLSKGVKLRVEDKAVYADVYVMVTMNSAVNETGMAVQSAVATAIESTTGLAVASVNVHICGVTFKKESK